MCSVYQAELQVWGAREQTETEQSQQSVHSSPGKTDTWKVTETVRRTTDKWMAHAERRDLTRVGDQRGMRILMLLLNSGWSEGVHHERQMGSRCVGPEVGMGSEVLKEETEGKSSGVKPSGCGRLLLPRARTRQIPGSKCQGRLPSDSPNKPEKLQNHTQKGAIDSWWLLGKVSHFFLGCGVWCAPAPHPQGHG